MTDNKIKYEPGSGRFEWTAARIAVVKAIAMEGGTAREAAEAVGLDIEREYLVYKLARREGFQFSNVGRKRDDSFIAFKLDPLASEELTARARHHKQGRRELASKLLTLVLKQGPIFIDNLLDEA